MVVLLHMWLRVHKKSGFLAFCLLITLMTLCSHPAHSQQKYSLQYYFVDKDSSFKPEQFGLLHDFNNMNLCLDYVNKLPALLQSKGFISASVDSLFFDTVAASAWVYTGQVYQWINLATDSADKSLLSNAGWNPRNFRNKPLDFDKLQQGQEKIMNWLEDNGHPFGKVELDSISLDSGAVSARLKITRGPLYKVDSIRVYGKAKISKNFLQKYLGIENGSIYQKSKLSTINNRLLELPYLKQTQPWDITMLGTGSLLNLYLEPKKSSQVNALVGFLPNNSQTEGNKLLLTGEVNINLKNALGGGETIGVNWQQLQVKSPRLNLLFQQPYIFRSPFGFDFAFDLYKKDSTYLNLNVVLGLQYAVSTRQTGRLFFQSFHTNLLTVDTNYVKSNKALPPYADVSTTNLGLDYTLYATDYRYNPRKGNEWNVLGSVGLRNIKENSTILALTTDQAGQHFPFASLYDTVKLKTYLIKLRLAGAHYFKLGKLSTFKTGLNGGLIQSEQIFNNEVYQIGGYRLLRGFDEESIYATQYLVGTLEYRYLIGLNSYLFVFSDLGWARNSAYASAEEHSYWGNGLGIAFETKAGIINLSYAVGKRNDASFNFRQSKIHIGFVSLF